MAKFDPAAAKLAKFRDYLTYTVNNPKDSDGMKMVREARLEVKNERVAMEHLRKAFVDDAVQYQKGINEKAREYREEMEGIESHLQTEENKIDKWKPKESALQPLPSLRPKPMPKRFVRLATRRYLPTWSTIYTALFR